MVSAGDSRRQAPFLLWARSEHLHGVRCFPKYKHIPELLDHRVSPRGDKGGWGGAGVPL